MDAGLLDRVEQVVGELAAADPDALGDRETLIRLHRLLARLDAVTTRATGAFDQSQAWALDGAKTPGVWLAATCGLPVATGRRRVRLARALRHLPAAEAAWLAGELGADHVAALAHVRSERTSEALARDEAMLVEQARQLTYRKWHMALAYWEQLNDPDGPDLDAERARSRRTFHLSETFGGWRADGWLDPINGTIVSRVLRRIERELFAADWAAAKERLGREPIAAELDRTHAQHHADALVEMARRAETAPADGRRPEPCFTVFVNYETFAGRICELAGGTVIAPGALLPWLDEAWVRRMVFDGPSRVIDVGADRRLFDGATRLAAAAATRECFDEDLCDTPFDELQVDHIVPRSEGGPTVVSNGRLACGFHNRLRNRQPSG